MHQAILPALLACNVLSMDVYRRSRTVVYLNADIHEGRERGINVYILLKTDILTSAFRHWCSIYKWCAEIEVWNKEFLHTYSYAKYLPSNSVVSLGEILLKLKDLSKRMLEFYFFFYCKLEPLSQSCSFLNDRLQLISLRLLTHLCFAVVIGSDDFFERFLTEISCNQNHGNTGSYKKIVFLFESSESAWTHRIWIHITVHASFGPNPSREFYTGLITISLELLLQSFRYLMKTLNIHQNSYSWSQC